MKKKLLITGIIVAVSAAAGLSVALHVANKKVQASRGKVEVKKVEKAQESPAKIEEKKFKKEKNLKVDLSFLARRRPQ